jgi:hypothetical protein
VEVCFVADQIPPWGRAHRRIERETARELAKTIMRGQTHHGGKVDVALWWLAAFMALALLLLAPKIGRVITVVVLVGMEACLVHPLWQIGWVQRASGAKKIKRYVAILLAASVIVSAFGIYVWPPLRRHRLDESEAAAFEKPLKDQREAHEEIQIACSNADEAACIYAEQFINLFLDAGWKVRGNRLDRVTLARPWAGVRIFKKGIGKLDPNNWRSGLWTKMSPSLENVYQAFVNIEVEPEEGSNPDLGEDEITLYFGSEKPDESEKTTMTDMVKNMREYRKMHPFTPPQQK